uniref:U6 snRNA m(6)A methyltransferase n=1 Tax=Glossina palpalis gambiensis TaxID=67801 RepID=A0A1B0C222_9MUSC
MSRIFQKQMHVRNVFRTPPDYTDLAIKYPEFRKVCRLELNGKVYIDYKNEMALRALTRTLLLEYFQLDVEFAPGSLVPTLPLRLNYILWLEDLLESRKEDTIKGIDIGCGSSCIYSLLAAKKNKWSMLALESNLINLDYANGNIERNNLQKFVTLFAQKQTGQIFREYFENNNGYENFDFCLCNPPFYDTLASANKTRNPQKRPPPHNCPTGFTEELFCEGGEVKFVEKIITESLMYAKEIRIFTTMLGHKSSLSKVLDILKENKIQQFCSTEFHQGNTTRWGIAWSFCLEFS